MSDFAHRNAHFDRLFANTKLFWLGQNTNHLPMHPKVRQALVASIEAEEFHAYAPPGGFISLTKDIVADLGLPQEATDALITDRLPGLLPPAQQFRDHGPRLEMAVTVCPAGRLRGPRNPHL
jgi:hypothetical protein